MDIKSWINSLPNNPCLERDRAILKAVENNIISYKWVSITSKIKNHTAIFQVCDDAIRVEIEDGTRFRFQVSATLAQQCADAMDASFITAKISDLSYQQAEIIVDASILYPTPDMVTINRSKDWNRMVEKKRAGRIGLFRDCGKSWILSNRLSTTNGAINYGFYDHTAPYVGPGGLNMWQTVGTRHDRLHTDYSQTLLLMNKKCQVDGKSTNVVEVMKNPELASLLSYEGVLHHTRQPGV